MASKNQNMGITHLLKVKRGKVGDIWAQCWPEYSTLVLSNRRKNISAMNFSYFRTKTKWAGSFYISVEWSTKSHSSSMMNGSPLVVYWQFHCRMGFAGGLINYINSINSSRCGCGRGPLQENIPQ